MASIISSLSVLFLVLAQLSTCFCHLSKEFKACSQPFKCGNITNLSYPFYDSNRPSYCGHPGFELFGCNQITNPIQLKMLSHNFNVLGINTKALTINVSREDYYSRAGCPSISLDNIKIDFSIFDYTTHNANLTLVYGDCASKCNSSWFYACPMSPTEFLSVCFLTKKAMLSSNISQVICPKHVFLPVLLSDYLEMDKDGKYLAQAAWHGFELKWSVNNGLCDLCLRSGGQCGHEPRSNNFFCFCTDEHKCPFPGSTPYKATLTKSKIAIIAIFCAFGVVSLVALLCYLRRCSRNRESQQKSKQNVEAFLKNHGTIGLQRYTYSDLKKITNSFKDKLGEGAYGAVYKGKIPGTDNFIAVKVLKKSAGDAEEFINEVASIGKTNHVNVVTLLGFCYEGRKRALIYNFMVNGSLEKYLYGRNNQHLLSWQDLLQIAVGIARGLEYLHRGCNTRILHFDIKPHNILLDENLCPKISDFGLAKLCPQKESLVSISEARGTIGYISPEVFLRSFGGVSYKSDVYSYGMLVLEMVGCRRKVNFEGNERGSEKYFPQWIYEQLEVREEFGDDEDEGLSSEEREIQKKMILVSLACVKTNPSSRPEMSKVLDMLEGSVDSLQLPRISSLAPSSSVIVSSSVAPSSDASTSHMLTPSS